MKLLIFAACLTAINGDVSHILKSGGSEKDSQILRHELDIAPDGTYQWQYETENGISAGERGVVNNADSDNAELAVQGTVSYTSPEGEKIELQYIADKDGYRAQGPHLPTPPPIPEAIVRSLEYIRSHPPPPEKN